MKTLKAEVRLPEEDCNNMNGRDQVMTALGRITKNEIKIVDLDKRENPYWQNDKATLVIEVRVSDADMNFAIQLADFTANERPDEFNTKPNREAGTVIMRFWWD